MKIDFSQQLKNLDGVGFHEDGTPLTLGTMSCAALLAIYQDEGSRLSGEEKFQRYDLAAKIHKNAEVEVSAEDVARLKGVIGKFYGTAVVGPAYVALNVAAPVEQVVAEEKPAEKPQKTLRRKLNPVPTSD